MAEKPEPIVVEKKPSLVTSELNIFFDQNGVIGMGGGLHMKLMIPGTPTVETITALVQRVREWGVEQNGAQPPEDTTVAPLSDEEGGVTLYSVAGGRQVPGCPKHKRAPKVSKNPNTVMCTAKVGQGWCLWRASYDDEHDIWEEWESK